ncbi:MAG: bifunctional phosphoglucose/phosphomannose isomerase [Candidatus Bathyarchaeota archaeon]|nr:bifunctional phosphoglucose/phosphomannose isomerase [Candidatus Bathyarchaeum tardum]WGM88699.1 MAG: bifunctional phosphoglucose/phosphomannose isomerase [Candidatus Bathyarchaeum tardum]WNZ29045.1 MAG: bifunctional phosphoglucose/phosphomannose isomerase [Candidatus Bathyarchaeota archaeon]
MVIVLNDPKKVKEIDKSDMLGDLDKTSDYCKDAIKQAQKVTVAKNVKPQNIVIVGMGGSAIGGELLKDWLRDTLPICIDVCRDYTLPAYVNDKTLIIANSYSGNTEETLTAFLSAIQKKCTVVAVTSGGQLGEFCKKLHLPHVLIPSGLQPRAAIPYLFFPVAILLQKMDILSNVEDELEEAIKIIEVVSKENNANIPMKDNKAKTIAEKILNTIPVVYGFRQYTSVAHRLKAQFNENSKVPSKSDSFPELNHNETVGYDAPTELTKKLSVILIRDIDEPLEIKNRIETTAELVLKNANSISEIYANGQSKLAKMFSVLCLSDYISVYLAILQSKDPSPVKIIDKVKAELTKKNRMKEHFEAELAKLK